MPVHPDNLAWIDLEMTGLDPEVDRIIEIATIVTDKELRVLAEGPSLVVHQPDALLDAMDEWNTRTHGESGLTQRVRDSRITESEAEERTLAFLSKWVGPRASPICGNSVHQDRRFLVRYMPRLEAFFHYRNVDVSTLKELAKRWAPDVAAGYTKESVHLALEEIRDSIRELQYYREKLFR
jgi:oligoribonuclease